MQHLHTQHPSPTAQSSNNNACSIYIVHALHHHQQQQEAKTTYESFYSHSASAATIAARFDATTAKSLTATAPKTATPTAAQQYAANIRQHKKQQHLSIINSTHIDIILNSGTFNNPTSLPFKAPTAPTAHKHTIHLSAKSRHLTWVGQRGPSARRRPAGPAAVAAAAAF